MRRSIFGVTMSMACLLCAPHFACSSGTTGGRAGSDDLRLHELEGDVRDLISSARDRVFPALVNVDVVTLEYDGGKESKSRSNGSGTIISPEGYVLTNAHVTDGGHRFWCVLADKQRLPAELIGEDPWTDLAILKLDMSGYRGDRGKLPHADFGDSSRLATGDYVIAMGSPFALSRTVTFGVVSNTERVFTSGAAGDAGEIMLNWEQRTGIFTNWIQHDALINPGNSGGPLVNLAGQVVGVNTRGGSGMAFATPSNHAQQVAESLIRLGDVPRSSVGASFRHLQNTGIDRGVLVDSVETDGPGWRAGLRPGDVVTAIDGEPVTVRYVEELPSLLRKLSDRPIGSTVAFTYTRALGIITKGDDTSPGATVNPTSAPDAASATASVTTESLRRDRGDEAGLRTWGLTAQRITPRAAQLRKLPTTDGALVTSIRGGGPADQAEPKIGWGDVIRSVDGTTITSLQSLIDVYTRIDAMTSKPEFVLVEFERDRKSFVTLIDPTPAERPDPPVELPKAWVGIATQPVVKTMAEKLGHPDQRGFRVMKVYTGTEAAKAGLAVGDIILKFNGEEIAPKGLQDAGLFNRTVRRASIGSDAKLTVLRAPPAGGGQRQVIELPIKLEQTRQTPEEARRFRSNDFELAAREITFFDRQDNVWDDAVTGVLVESVESAGWAGLGGVQPGDLIQRIDTYQIADLAAFKRAMEAISKDKPERVVFVVLRGPRTFFRFVEPDWTPTTAERPRAARE